MQHKAQGGVIWIDEAGLLPIDDLDALCGVAETLDARIVLQGDPRQHKSVARHGNMLGVLEDHAGLPVAKLTTIQRQKGDYARGGGGDPRRRAWPGATTCSAGSAGWSRATGHDALVAEYARAIEETKPDGRPKSVLVIDPTHKDGDAPDREAAHGPQGKGPDRRGGAELPAAGAAGLDRRREGRSRAATAAKRSTQFFRNSGALQGRRPGEGGRAAAGLGRLNRSISPCIARRRSRWRPGIR